MTLKKQTLTFPFAKGLNEKASDKVTPVGELTEAKNVVFDKAGQLIKRGAFVKQGGDTIAFSDGDSSIGTSLDSATYTTSYGDEILTAGKGGLFARSGLTMNGSGHVYTDKGPLVSCEAENSFLLRNENYKHGPAHIAYAYYASVPTLMLVTYVRAPISGSHAMYEVMGEVRDAETKNLIHQESIATVNYYDVGDDRLYRVPAPRAIVLGDYGYILYLEPSFANAKTKIRYVGIDLGLPLDAGSLDIDNTGFVGPSDLPNSDGVSYHRPVFDVDVATSAGNTTVSGESPHGSAAAIVGSMTGSNLNVVTFTDNTCDTASSTTVTMDSTANIRPGDAVSGSGIPGGATVVLRLSTTQFQLSAAATSSLTNTTLTFTRGVNESSADGTLRFEYFKSSGTNLVSFGTPVSTTSLTVGNDGAGSSGNCEAFPAFASDTSIVSGLCVKAINDTGTPANGQIFYAVNNYKASGTQVRQKYALIARDLGSEKTMLASYTGFLMRASAISESDSDLRVIAELANASGGSATTGRPDNHEIISFKMSRSTATQTSFTPSLSSYVVARNSSIASDLFIQGSKTYFVLSFLNGKRNSLSGNNLLMEAPPISSTTLWYRPVAAIGMGDNSATFTSDFLSGQENGWRFFTHPSRVYSYTNVFRFGANRFSNLVEYSAVFNPSAASTYEDETHSPSVMEINFAPNRVHKSLTTPNGMLLTGGMLYHYDGFRLHENNFFGFPVFDLDDSNTGGAIANGTYLYRVVYEWYDDMGNVHRSAASESKTAVITGSNVGKVTLAIYVLQHTLKREGVFDSANTGIRACVYRTTAAGSVYHKVGSINLSAKESSITDSFIDYGGIDDTELVDNELLYTQAGLQANAFVGSCKDLCMHKERVFVTTSTNAVKFSKYMLSRDGVNFTDNNELRVSSEKIDINAIEASREALLMFTESDGYYVGGDGPDNAGIGSFTQPRVFAAGVGALPGAEHAFFSGGTLLQTNRGIMNILPNLQLDYIGANIEDLLGTKTVPSIVVDEDTSEVRFLVQNKTSSSANIILVYNTLFRQWTSHEIAYSSSNYGVSLFAQSMNGSTSLYLATADGSIHTYSPKVYQDTNTGSSANYDMVVQTGYLNVAGLQALQRVYRCMVLGKFLNSHTLTFDVFTDYDDSTSSTFTGAVSVDANPYQYRVHLSNQKCRAVKVKITISGASSSAVNLDGIALEVGARPGTFKLPAAQTIGA